MGDFEQLEMKEQLDMVELNCKALTAVTYMAIPHMVRNGRIIQLASAAAFGPQAHFAVYAATKSYVLSFSRALQEELIPREIYVTAVCPGPVDTPFFDIAEKTGSTLAIKKYTMVEAERVVDRALKDSYQKRTLSVCSIPIQAFAVATKLLPHDVYLYLMKLLKKMQ